MPITITPHLNFRGTARKALELYREAFGGELSVITYADMGNANTDTADHVVWGQVEAGNGFRIMAHDVYPPLPWHQGQNPFYVSVRGTSDAELQGYWDKLATGGSIIQPLGPSQWAPLYGQLTDAFGVTWVLDLEAAYTPA